MRKAGIGAVRSKNVTAGKFKEKVDVLQENQLNSLKKQSEVVRSALEEFSVNHKNEIKKNPEFRNHFHSMCVSIGVDPLSYSKGKWSSVLGLGEFYYALGIKVIELCIVYQSQTGGLVLLADLVDSLNRRRKKNEDEITEHDVIQSIKQLKSLGNGFSIFQPANSNKTFIQSLPVEIGLDVSTLLGLAETSNGKLTIDSCSESLNWTKERCQIALEQLVREGFAWIDGPNGKLISYWITSLFKQ